MYRGFAVLSGIILSVMISLNGGLSAVYGVFFGTVITHIVGFFFALILYLIKNEKKNLFDKRPIWKYLGGAVGVFTVLFNNSAFGKISVTSIVALSLFGQTVSSLIVDQLGILGMKKRKFEKSSLIGLVFSIIGIIILLDTTVSDSFFAVWLAMASGVTVVISRVFNTGLSKDIGPLSGSLVTHFIGTIVAFIIMIIALKGFPEVYIPKENINPLIYLGGVLGVIIVYLSNITVPKTGSFIFTISVFASQILTGVVLDLILSRTYSTKMIIAGIIIGIGSFITVVIDEKGKK